MFFPRTTLHRTISSAPKDHEYIGQSGRHYTIERVIHEEPFPLRRVYLTTAKNQNYILKYIHDVNYADLQNINNRLRGNADHVCLIEDIIPSRSMFVFQYLDDHLLRLAQKNLPLKLTKRILKDALRGIAELHDQDIVHTDIKPDNILVDWKENENGISIERVQIADLEDAAHNPPGSHMIGKEIGNWMWRSPEGHASGSVNKPSDIWSFALVCIYAVHKCVIFAVDPSELEEGIEPLAVVLERQISYFANADSLQGFLKHLGSHNPWYPIFEVIRDGFNGDNPRRPFSLWKGVDDDFKDLICSMTDFDPEKRVTAKEALAHRWFEGV